MKPKRFFALLLSALMLFTLFSLAACDSTKNNENNTDQPTESEAPEIPLVSDGKFEYVFTAPGDGSIEWSVSLCTYTDADIVIPDTYNNGSVTGIEAGAFMGCTNLSSITLPNSVTRIEGSAFEGCTNLSSITVHPDNQVYKSIDGNLYTKDGTGLVRYMPGKSDTSFIIPDNVKRIHPFAFQDCTSLTSISIPDSVTRIEDATFQNCTSLTTISIPDKVEGIADSAFQNCTSLTTISIPDKVERIADSAFVGCTGLSSIAVDPNNQNYKSIDGDLYTKDSAGLVRYMPGKSNTSFTIPDSVTYIDDSAFEGCTTLTNISIPNGAGIPNLHSLKNNGVF